jgi:hypothetical protein
LAGKDNALFLAHWNNKISGFLTAHRLQRFDERKAEILLYEIGVNEESRKKGIGKALIEAVKAWGREVQADEVWVLTNRSNQAAMALYKSAGGLEASPDDMMFVFKLYKNVTPAARKRVAIWISVSSEDHAKGESPSTTSTAPGPTPRSRAGRSSPKRTVLRPFVTLLLVPSI